MVRNTRVVLHFETRLPKLAGPKIICGFLGLAMSCLCGCGPVPSGTEASKESIATQEKNAAVEKSKSPEKPKFDPSIDLESLLAARLPQEDLDNGWIRLFDTCSLTGWKATSNANWTVEDGSISVSEGEAGFLVTTSRFGDFELQFEYLAPSGTNSGVFLRTLSVPQQVDRDCFELNIAPVDNPFPTGSLVGRKRAEPESIGELDDQEWHSMHALCDGKRVQTWVDGKIASEYEDTSDLKSGLIGLQFREGPIKFRNIRLRPISYSTLPAETLEGWQSNPSANANEGSSGSMNATRTDKGEIKIQGGKGAMELLQNLGNFVLQSTVLVESSNVNTGIFFRCIPGEEMNGYECQVHHGFIDDRRLAKDAGMGAIFRRQNARAVLSDEGKPTHLTIIADGPHIATWVEGIQVVDWTDTRQPHENPREGLRVEPGTIQLQGHDPTTEALFQTLQISPIP